MSRRAASALALLPLFGCDPASPQACEAAAETPGVLEIGTGESDFQAVSDGDEVQVAWGSQGGKHVWGSLRAEGIVIPAVRLSPEDDPLVDFLVHDTDGVLVAGYEGVTRPFERDADGDAVFVGETLQLNWTEEGYDGREVVLSARVEDGCGRVLESERIFTLLDPA